MDNFDLKKYLAEGRIHLSEDEGQNIADFLNANYKEIASKLGNPGSNFEIIGDNKVATAGDGNEGIDISFDKNHMDKLFPKDDPYNEVKELTIAGKVVYYNDYRGSKMNEERKGQDKLDDLEAALTDQHAKNVISSGRFTTIDTFGNGEDVTPLKNVTKELEKELEYLKNNDMVDTDEYDDASDDLEAAQEIAQVVKKMGGEVAYGGDGLMYVYTVNGKGDLLGQAV